MAVIVKLQGGTANQLFQYALGRRIADKNKDRLLLDTSYYSKAKHCSYQLDKFNIRVDQPAEEDKGAQYSVIHEARMSFTPEVLDLKGNILLQGYWQNPKYVSDYIVEELWATSYTLHNTCPDYKGCAIHVRGKDYRGWTKFDVCTYDYYNKAFKVMKSKGFKKFYVFTDDIDYTNYMLHDISKECALIYLSDCEIHDLFEISCFDGIIGSNSTFSWWGWRLGDKRVSIFPSKWFNEEPNNTDHLDIDLYDPQMILIDP